MVSYTIFSKEELILMLEGGVTFMDDDQTKAFCSEETYDHLSNLGLTEED